MAMGVAKWQSLEQLTQWKEVLESSYAKDVYVFKHSTRCGISHQAWDALQKEEAPENAAFYFLDLLAYRAISNAIASDVDVLHKSPQLILIRKGKAVHSGSHAAARFSLVHKA